MAQSGQTDDDEDQITGDDDDSGDDDTDTDSDDDGDSGSGKSKDEDGGTVTKADFDKLQQRLKAADRRASTAEKEAKALKAKDQTELERVQTEATESATKLETMTAEISSLRMQNAFLMTNSVSWHDPEAALELARSKKYLDEVVDEEGEVDKKALKTALDKFAKDHKYLVKAKTDSEDDEDEEDEKPGPSGESSKRRSKNSKDTAAKEQRLKATFPALGRR